MSQVCGPSGSWWSLHVRAREKDGANFKGWRGIQNQRLTLAFCYTGISTCLSSCWVSGLRAEHRADFSESGK